MKYISIAQRLSPTEHTVEDTKYGIFIGVVDFVDYETHVLSVRDLTTNILYERVEIQPANSSSDDLMDATIPNIGAKCLCANISSNNGFVRIAVMQWLFTSAKLGTNATAYRTKEQAPGFNARKRFLYRKAYPGQHTVNLSEGYTALEDSGWDQQAQDLTRDKVDTFRRTRYQITGTNVNLDESGMTVSGQVIRDGSADTNPVLLPNGDTIQTVCLKDGSRFDKGSDNSIPLVEKLELVQEFGLDYPVPQETIGSEELTKVLGILAPQFSKTTISGDTDDQSFYNDQPADAPYDNNDKPIGSTTKDCVSYRRKGYILEGSKGTLVGYNAFDDSTFGKVLKPILFPNTKAGRFSSSVESGYLPVVKSKDEVESVIAASAFSMRFPYEYNTTRFDITKEGLVQFEIGSTIPKENLPLDGSKYEHPHGAGRSLEGHFVGSVKLVVGKNRDEEDSLDLTTLGQVVLRLGSDDSSSLDQNRDLSTQIRSSSDSILQRDLQVWKPIKSLGDAGSLDNKTAFERVSLRGAFDGGTILRLGARDPGALRKHLYNGYQDGQGRQEYGTGSSDRKDARTEGRKTYGSGDDVYAFHDLTTAGSSKLGLPPYFYSGAPISNMDRHGLSLDVHAVRDVLLRIGANEDSGQSLAIDLGGGMVAYLGKDKKGRSITASLDGGAEITIKANDSGRALQLEIDGDVNIMCHGHWHQYVSGDYFLESTNKTEITKCENQVKAMNIRQAAMVQHVSEAPDIVHNQGLYESGA
jgi:hypothetical protein